MNKPVFSIFGGIREDYCCCLAKTYWNIYHIHIRSAYPLCTLTSLLENLFKHCRIRDRKEGKAVRVSFNKISTTLGK